MTVPVCTAGEADGTREVVGVALLRNAGTARGREDASAVEAVQAGSAIEVRTAGFADAGQRCAERRDAAVGERRAAPTDVGRRASVAAARGAARQRRLAARRSAVTRVAVESRRAGAVDGAAISGSGEVPAGHRGSQTYEPIRTFGIVGAGIAAPRDWTTAAGRGANGAGRAREPKWLDPGRQFAGLAETGHIDTRPAAIRARHDVTRAETARAFHRGRARSARRKAAREGAGAERWPVEDTGHDSRGAAGFGRIAHAECEASRTAVQGRGETGGRRPTVEDDDPRVDFGKNPTFLGRDRGAELRGTSGHGFRDVPGEKAWSARLRDRTGEELLRRQPPIRGSDGEVAAREGGEQTAGWTKKHDTGVTPGGSRDQASARPLGQAERAGETGCLPASQARARCRFRVV